MITSKNLPSETFTLIRYPGSKAKLYKAINKVLSPGRLDPFWRQSMTCYCEPFVGSGAIAWKILKSAAMIKPTPQVILNDADLYVARLWMVVRDRPGEFIRFIAANPPSLTDFERFKATDGDPSIECLQSAYRKVVLHQTSFSGLGYKAGSVIGGKSQGGAYKFNSRWRPDNLGAHIRRIAAILKQFPNVGIFSEDFQSVLKKTPAGATVYCDPPFYVQGTALYKCSMADVDHARLAHQLYADKSRYHFILSYDDHPRIHELYEGWANVRKFEMTPTIQEQVGGKRRKNNELVITNF